MFAKIKNFQKMIKYTFLQINLCVITKTLNVQISFDGFNANQSRTFLCKTFPNFMSQAFKKAKNYQNLTTKSGCK